jgi:cellulose synthase (UDP-forming)
MLAYMLIPLAVVGTGAIPIEAPGIVFAPFFLATLILQYVAQRLLARGRYRPVLSVLFEVLRMPAVLPATLAVFAPGRARSFKVTPKGRNPGGRTRTPVPRLLTVLAVASSAGLAWFALTLLGLGPVQYIVPWAAIGAAFFMAMNLALLLAAIGRIRSSRFAGNRRAAVRLPVSLPAALDGRRCEVLDLSVTGARVLAATGSATGAGAAATVDRAASLVLDPDGEAIHLECTVRRTAAVPGGLADLGLEFNPGQEAAVARLAVRLFHQGVRPQPARSAERRPGLVWRQAAA